MTRNVAAAIVLAATTACVQSQPAALSTSDSTALRALDSTFVDAILTRDWSALASQYADDAVLMPPDAPAVTGPTAISEWFAGAGLEMLEFTTHLSAMEGHAAFAALRGTYRMVFTVPSAPVPVTDSGKFVWLVKRGPDQRWRISTDIWNTNTSPP